MILEEINLNIKKTVFQDDSDGDFKPVRFRWIDRKQWHCVYETMILQMEVEKVHLQVLEHVQHRPRKKEIPT
jgi:hypothetical protein